MKKLAVILILTLSLCLSTCSERRTLYEYILTVDAVDALSEKELPKDELFCGHNKYYHTVDIELYERASGYAQKTYDLIPNFSDDKNIESFIDISHINKDNFIEYLDEIYPEGDMVFNPDIKARAAFDPEIIYSGDDIAIGMHFNQNCSSFKASTIPTKNFFIIHGAVIRYIGKDKYMTYLSHVYGTKYDNISNLIHYFNIDKVTFINLMNCNKAADFYNCRELFE